MRLKDSFKINQNNISRFNQLQFIGALLLQFLIPFIKMNSIDSSGFSTRTTIYFFYSLQADTNRLLIPYIFLTLLILTFYLFFVQKKVKYFDAIPLSLAPILSYTFFNWLNSVTIWGVETLPRVEIYFEWGYMVLIFSFIAYYAIYLYLKLQKNKLSDQLKERKEDVLNSSLKTGLEIRWIAFLLCFSVLPIAVTTPALGIFSIKFMNSEELTFFTAFGAPLYMNESYFYYRIYSAMESLVNTPIFFSFITFIIFITGILAIRSLIKHSTIKIVEVFFIITTLIFLLLINAFAIFALYFFFSWLLIPFWMIYDGQKDLKLRKEGITLFTFLLALGTILIFIQFILPFDLGLFTIYPALEQIRKRPNFIFLIFPYLLSVINRMGKPT